jgi:tetratricopeptide (TPR) repeat protein
MPFQHLRAVTPLAAVLGCLCLNPIAGAQQSSSSSQQPYSSSSQESVPNPGPPQEQSPTLDPAGPTIELISSEQLFVVASALNVCGYDEGLKESAPIRAHVRDELNQAFTHSEDARKSRDALCLYIAQHRMTGTEHDISQYISLALYLTSPPDEMETVTDLSQMPPDATAVFDVVPLLNAFMKSTDLHGIWLAAKHTYDEQLDQLHDPLSKMIVSTNLYLKQPAETYSGRRFIVVMEPMLSPLTANARIYGADYVVVVSPHNGQIPLNDVRHTYLHYTIEPLLYARSNAIDRMQPIMKEIRDAPIALRYRSDPVPLSVECLIKAIEARTMDTGIPNYQLPAGVPRSDMPKYEHQRQEVEQRQEAVRLALVHHDMTQGFVLTQYFYDELIQFEKDPASLKDSIGEMVYAMDVDQQVHRIKQIQFDAQTDEDVLVQPKPHKLEGLDLAEFKLQSGDLKGAAALANQVAAEKPGSPQSAANSARADFILARVAAMTGHPDQAIDRFQETLANSQDARLIAWSHIYLGRMLDLDCKRDAAVAEYKLAYDHRDGQQDTRLAAERGLKTAYAVNGHSCQEDDAAEAPANPAAPAAPASKPQ